MISISECMDVRNLATALIFLLFGLGVLGGVVYSEYPKYEQRTQSVAVDAEVQSSEFSSYAGGPDSADQESHSVTVVYTYTYEGQKYESDSVFPGGTNAVSSGSRAEEVAGNYAAGDRITAYVLPSEPEQSYLLEKGHNYWNYLFVLVGALMAFAGLRHMVRTIRGNTLDV